jgi:hypothetical protein
VTVTTFSVCCAALRASLFRRLATTATAATRPAAIAIIIMLITGHLPADVLSYMTTSSS